MILVTLSGPLPVRLEDEVDLDKVHFQPEVFGAIVEGYLESAGEMLEPSEIDHLALAPQVITYELGLRFLAIIWTETFISRSSDPVTTSTVREPNSSFCPLWKNISAKWRKSLRSALLPKPLHS